MAIKEANEVSALTAISFSLGMRRRVIQVYTGMSEGLITPLALRAFNDKYQHYKSLPLDLGVLGSMSAVTICKL